MISSLYKSQTFIISTTTTTRLNYANTEISESFNDPYIILDLDPTVVDVSSIKKAYRKLALKYHPDATIGLHRSDEEKDQSNQEFVRVNAAYAFLIGKSDQMPEATICNRSNTSGHHTEKKKMKRENFEETPPPHQQQTRAHIKTKHEWQYRPHDEYTTIDATTNTSSTNQSRKSASSPFSTNTDNTTSRRVRVHEPRPEKQYHSSHLPSCRTYDGLCIKVQKQLHDLQQQYRGEYGCNPFWQQKYSRYKGQANNHGSADYKQGIWEQGVGMKTAGHDQYWSHYPQTYPPHFEFPQRNRW